MSGNERIKNAFAKDQNAALMPYFTIGYPDFETSIEIIAACCNAGADLMELGVPFSDPLADGPTIQHSTQVALQKGVTVGKCIEAVKILRDSGIATPFMLMGYANPMIRYGTQRYVEDSAAAGADGFIIPDLPPDESGPFSEQCEQHGLGLIHLLAPNSTPDRAQLVLDHSNSFVYLVSITGITGARNALPSELENFIKKIRTQSGDDTPLAVGFGIGTKEQASSVAAYADGVIVGSALINVVREAINNNSDPVEAASAFVLSLAEATH